MDKIDYQILKCLKENSRISTSAIGETINMSVSAVSERIKRLENSGVIERYTAILNYNKVGKDVKAFISIRLEHPKYCTNFDQEIKKNPQVLECHYVAGDYDYMLKVVAKSTADLEKVIQFIKSIGGVHLTKTQIVLSSSKEEFTAMPSQEDLVK